MICTYGWRSYEAEAHASNCRASETCYGGPENIGIAAVVIPELSLSDIQRQILCGNLVIAANDGPLEQAPEAFNRVGVDRADNVLLGAAG
jgi:tetrahydromethanopterin S-methyltransferase subunit A